MNNIDVVIIGHNEGMHIDNMISCIPSEWHIIYVADRCSDDTIPKLRKYSNVNIIDTSTIDLKGRQTSFCRNLGLFFTNKSHDVLFLDGDRYVTSGNIASISGSTTDITLLTLENDGRNNPLFDINAAYGTVYNGFFSCGIFIKRSAIEKITSHELMQNGNGCIPQVFPEFLQNDWGIEDTSLGDLCFDIGLSVSIDKNIRLRGRFTKHNVDSLDVIEKRFQFRSKLSHVKW